MTRRAIAGWMTGLLLIALALGPNFGLSASAQTPSAHRLPGYVPPAVTDGTAQDQGPQPDSDIMSIAVSIPLRNLPDLNAFLASVNDPSSPNYHRYLSQTEANDRFNPTNDQQQQVVNWLRSAGLTVTRTYPNHLLVDAIGSTRQINKAFGIQEHSFTANIHGHQARFFAPTSDPMIDASVSGLVQSIVGLDSYPRIHRPHLSKNGNADTRAPYFPQDMANAYDMGPLWGAGGTGAGEHIGITLWTVPASDTTLNAWATKTGASVPTTANGRLKVIKVDGGNSVIDDGEAGMDIEFSSAMAPLASVDYYEAQTDATGNPTEQGLVDALNLAGSDANNNRQITNSWGECEPTSKNDSFVSALESLFATNTATGHTYVFSSGDAGSLCDGVTAGSYVNPWPDYPASSQYVTSVGGTKFSANVSSTWPGEAAWPFTACSASCQRFGGSPEGSGGGFSAIFSRPSWQTGIGTSTKRAYPDVSADSDPNTGAYVCYGGNKACAQIGGTSLASPMWAGILAATNSYLGSIGGAYAGFLTPSIYYMATHAQPYAPFHDITIGSNGKYSATAGWDAVTGWGSVDVYNFARDVAALSGSLPTPTVTDTPLPTDTPTVTDTPGTPTDTPVPTDTPISTDTPIPTDTSIPTDTPVATNTPKITSTPTRTATPVAQPTNPQLILNGGFESGVAPWSETSRNNYEILTSTRAHTGARSAWLCGYKGCDDKITQIVTVPAKFTGATLGFWMYIASGTLRQACTDNVYARLTRSTGSAIAVPLSYCNTSIGTGWIFRSANVTATVSGFKGQPVGVQFEGITTSTTLSSFYVDDVTLSFTGVTAQSH